MTGFYNMKKKRFQFLFKKIEKDSFNIDKIQNRKKIDSVYLSSRSSCSSSSTRILTIFSQLLLEKFVHELNLEFF